MDNSKKDKVKHQFSPAEAADYLRQLADSLEQGHIELRSKELELEGDVKVKQELKTKSGKATLKINLKIVAPMPVAAPKAAPAAASDQDETQGEAEGFVEITPQEDDPGDGDGKPSYKKLKKAMSKSFGNLRAMRKEGNLPIAEDVATFVAQGREICTFESDKYGPESYADFLAALDKLEAASAAGDDQSLDAALSDLWACRSECHKKYK